MHTAVAWAATAALTLAPFAVLANEDIDRLRAEFQQKLEALTTHYEERLKALEARAAAPAPQAVPAAPATTASTQAASGSGFNPEISLILQGQYRHRKNIDERHIAGFLSGGHSHGGDDRGFSLDHTELVFSANVDPYFRGYAAIALVDEEVEVEEAWFQTLALGHGFTVKGGRFLSGVGYANEQHAHQWDFVDQSLMYQAIFGEHLIQDGVQLKWLAPTKAFLEFGAEAARGQFFPGSDEAGNRNGFGTWGLFAKVGGDVGTSNSWRFGLNYLAAKPEERESHVEDLSDTEAHAAFSGNSKMWIADFVWKWAPNHDPSIRNFKLQAEYFRRTEDGELVCEDNTADGGLCTDLSDDYRSRQSGWYAQAVYQFMPRWRVGYRYDRLSPGSVRFGANPIETSSHRPQRHSLMLDYSPSEFSRLRLQLARDRSMEGLSENQLTLQYIHSLGAHGAHRF